MEAEASGRLEGERVAFTGRLASRTRDELRPLLRGLGAQFHERVGPDTSLLVLGQEGWPLRADGRLTRDLQEAQRLQAQPGPGPEIVPEEEFLRRAGLGPDDASRRLYTLEQLARILGVPRAEVRSWVRQGLVQPVQTVRRLCTFDFAQVAAARTLVRLREQGVSVHRIQDSLRRLGRWLPEAERSRAGLELSQEAGRVVVELDDGRRMEPGGQLQLDFAAAGEAGSVVPRPADGASRSPTLPGIAERWEQTAVRHEEAGEYELSARAYHRALLAGEPRAELCFNLGNVLHALARSDAAAQRFMQAVELEPEYVEAWNNLGNVLCESGEWDEAVEAYQRALELEPEYPDAHYNFGECLHQIGDWERAREHWQAYLRLDPDSAWSERVRALLADTEDREPRSRP